MTTWVASGKVGNGGMTTGRPTRGVNARCQRKADCRGERAGRAERVDSGHFEGLAIRDGRRKLVRIGCPSRGGWNENEVVATGYATPITRFRRRA